MAKNTPPNWQPPAPAWQSVWHSDEAFVVSYFALQGDKLEVFEGWVRTILKQSGVLSIEQAIYRVAEQGSNYIYVCYWRESDYQQWWLLAQSSWADLAQRYPDQGFWREIFYLPQSHFETLHSSETPHGLGENQDDINGPMLEHGYPGGARDRIALSERQSLRATCSLDEGLSAQINQTTQHYQFSLPPNICMIRSGQNWSDCGAEQKQNYLDNVHPKLELGMEYLRCNPSESGCYSMRLVSKTNRSWQDVEQTFGLGYACDIHAFENWAKSHPSHLAIFGSFMQMAGLYGEKLELKLWHEMAISSHTGSEAEYYQCHPSTGFIPYAKSCQLD